MFKKSSVIYKIILVIILCFVIQMPILSFFVNYYSDKLVLEATGKTTMGMLQVVVSEIDSSRYEELAASLDMQDIYYEELRLYLMEKRDQFELKYLYTESFGADGNTLYIVDGNDMDNDDFSAIGEEVNTVDEVSDTDASINCLHHGIPGYEISTYDGITLLSTYYPIKNGTGKVIGILGADFDASEVKESKNEFLNIFSLMLAAIAVVICTLLAIILKLMLRPLFELKRSMEGIGKGDLTIQIPVKTRDEVGYIINEFNRSSMMQRNIIRSVINSTDTIDNSVSCINSSMENLEKSAAHLLGSTDALSELVDKNSSHTQELNSMSQTLTGSMQQIMTDSENGISVANTVGEKASKLSHSFTASQKQAESVFINTQDTLRKAIEDAKSVGQIGVLAETILSISKKTNLLAINASIEASAAGEAGKGFAVVADEIRVLATNSKDAVEKIKMTTGVVISSVTNLSNSTEVLLQFVNEQVNADYNEMLRVVTEYSRDAQQFKGILAGFETILKDLDSSVNTSVAAIEDISKIAVQSAESVQLIGEELNLINKTIKDVKTQTNESKESSAQLLAGVKNFKV